MDKILTRLASNASFLNSIEDFNDFVVKLFNTFEKCIDSKQTLRSLAEENLKIFKNLKINVNVDILESLFMIIADILWLVAKPKAVHQCLLDGGLEAKRAEQFALIWRQQAGEIVNKIKKCLISNGEALQNIDWKVCIQTGNCDSRHQKLPFVELNVGLESYDMSFNLNNIQLKNLYDTLESVQSKLDELHQKST